MRSHNEGTKTAAAPELPKRYRVLFYDLSNFHEYLDRYFESQQSRFEEWLRELQLFLSTEEEAEATAAVLRYHQTRLYWLSVNLSFGDLDGVGRHCRNNPLIKYLKRYFDGMLGTMIEWLDCLYVYLSLERDPEHEPAGDLRHHQTRLYYLIQALEEMDLVDVRAM